MGSFLCQYTKRSPTIIFHRLDLKRRICTHPTRPRRLQELTLYQRLEHSDKSGGYMRGWPRRRKTGEPRPWIPDSPWPWSSRFPSSSGTVRGQCSFVPNWTLKSENNMLQSLATESLKLLAVYHVISRARTKPCKKCPRISVPAQHTQASLSSQLCTVNETSHQRTGWTGRKLASD